MGGVKIPVQGYIEVPIEVEGQKLRGSFLVVSDRACAVQPSTHPILLGCNILRHLTSVPIQKGAIGAIIEEHCPQEANVQTNRKTVRIHMVSTRICPSLTPVRRATGNQAAEGVLSGHDGRKTGQFISIKQSGDDVSEEIPQTPVGDSSGTMEVHHTDTGGIIPSNTTDALEVSPRPPLRRDYEGLREREKVRRASFIKQEEVSVRRKFDLR